MKRFILILLVGSLLVACNPFMSKNLRKKKKCIRKIEKIEKICPESVLRDTIIDTVEIVVPEIRIDTFFLVNDDVSGIDSIIDKFKGVIDSVTALKLKTEIKWYAKTRLCIVDTIRIDSLGIHIRIYQVGNKIYTSFYKEEEVIIEEVKVVVDRIVKPKLSYWEQFVIGFGKLWWWILIIIIMLALVYIFRKVLKAYIPWP